MYIQMSNSTIGSLQHGLDHDLAAKKGIWAHIPSERRLCSSRDIVFLYFVMCPAILQINIYYLFYIILAIHYIMMPIQRLEAELPNSWYPTLFSIIQYTSADQSKGRGWWPIAAVGDPKSPLWYSFVRSWRCIYITWQGCASHMRGAI